jgi:hypothetical protein
VSRERDVERKRLQGKVMKTKRCECQEKVMAGKEVTGKKEFEKKGMPRKIKVKRRSLREKMSRKRDENRKICQEPKMSRGKKRCQEGKRDVKREKEMSRGKKRRQEGKRYVKREKKCQGGKRDVKRQR